MLRYIRKVKGVEAEQYLGEDRKYSIRILMSDGWKPSGNWSDRFIEEPEKPTAYIINKTRIYLKVGDWVVKTSKGKYKIYTNKEFHKKYKKENE